VGMCALAILCDAQVRLTVKSKGAVVGSVETSQRLTQDGGRRVELRFSLGKDNAVTVHTTSTFDANGNPIRKVQETVTAKHDQLVVIATFDPSGANLVINDGSARKTKKVPLDAGSARAEIAGFWLLRDKPEKGASVKHFAFNMDSQAWDETATTYEGSTSIEIAGKTRTAHLVRSVSRGKTTLSYLDDKGEPLRIEAGAFLLERAP